MSHRMTVLVEDAHYERLQARARQRGTSVSDEVRAAVSKLLGEREEEGLLALTAIGSSGGQFPPVDSDEAKEQAARDIYRDTMNREPDW